MKTYEMYNPRTQTTEQITVGYITPEPIKAEYTVKADKKAVLRFLTSKKTVKAVAPTKKTVKREKPIIIKAKPKLTPKPLLCMKLVYSKPYALSDNLHNPKIPRADRKESLMELIQPLKIPYFITMKFGKINDSYTYRKCTNGRTKTVTIKNLIKAVFRIRIVNGRKVRCEYPKNQLKPEFNPNTPIEKGSLRELSQFVTLMVK